ncbi:hypothetical protein [Polynucleobacter sp. UK-Kesae-W10]|uniref:hypothetical protein n=1 Tax=Polynucleobacter sp. UK-Kesae-W10 TaxID=1819738 RepID=UPI001C0C35FF|nr:hypothetical protein [Polynucleobacter sp. UK-Kesae-W10]MBU3577548.1 hypothetical protein [Polynucleobacter sp. UK-Kesae-W10]
MSIITTERAGEIRGELTEKYGATWMHHYHEAIEAEVLRNLDVQLKDAARYQWLRDTNADRCDGNDELLIEGFIEPLFVCEGDGSSSNLMPHEFDLAIDAAMKCSNFISIQHLPSDDTEGGEV